MNSSTRPGEFENIIMPLFASICETAKILEDYEMEEDLANKIRTKIQKNE